MSFTALNTLPLSCTIYVFSMVRGFVPLCTGNVVISVMFQFLITHEENFPDVQQ